jgi:hypothetical protein
MKHGKIILSAAALVVTVATSFAFRASTKFNGHRQLWTKQSGTSCIQVSCYTAPNGTTINSACPALTSTFQTVAQKYYTATGCLHQFTGLQTTTF